MGYSPVLAIQCISQSLWTGWLAADCVR